MSDAVTKISITDDVTLFTIENIPNCIRTISNFFTDIEKAGISLDMISRAPTSKPVGNISFTIADDDFSRVAIIGNQLKKDIPELVIKADTGNCKINLYGEPMSTKPGVAAGVFRALSDMNGATIKLITTSEVDISLLVPQEDVDDAIACIQRHFSIKA